MKIDWTKYEPNKFQNEQFVKLLKSYSQGQNRENFWQQFIWLFQMGTSSVRSEADRQKIYQMAYEFIAESEHMRDCLYLRDVGTRVRLMRCFPFLAFKDKQNIGRRVLRKLLHS